MLWANLIHLSYNMWCDRDFPGAPPHGVARPYLRFDESLWNDLLAEMADAGMNAIVLDLGDGVRWKSHPEIAVENAWCGDKLRAELDKARSFGLEPIPKLNFSTAHDAWLGPYSRMVSTPPYYQVCAHLICEVAELFDGPRFFHLGMDEERADHQRHFSYAVMRQHELWWEDLDFLIERVQATGARPWVWSDQAWVEPEVFWTRMPRSVVQSNWYYGTAFETDEAPRYYRLFEEHGFDQIPTGSNWSRPENFSGTVNYCRNHIAPERLLGFLMAPWYPTLEECRETHMKAIAQVREAKALVR